MRTKIYSLPITALVAATSIICGCFVPPAPVGDAGGGETGTSGPSTTEPGGDAVSTGSADGAVTAGEGEGEEALGSTDEGTTAADDGLGSEASTDDAGAESTGGLAPTVVSIDPPLDAVGVLGDQSVMITFSEPMATTAVEAALTTTDLGAVTLAWNGDSTVLTIDPDADLAYATGDSPIFVDALGYVVSVGVGATDVGGTALEAAFDSNFSTARRITTTIVQTPAYTGGVVSTGALQTGAGDDPIVGDHSDNLARRGFMGFAITSLPAGIVQFEFAEVRAAQWLNTGDPIPSLGNVSIHHIAPEMLPGGAYASAEIEDLGIWSNEDSSSANNFKSATVTDNVAFDYEAGETHIQFRLQFPGATNFNSATDRCRYNAEALEITYLLP